MMGSRGGSAVRRRSKVQFGFEAGGPDVVGIVNINNNKKGTIGRVCERNVRSIDFMLYGASGRTLDRSPVPAHLRLKGRKLNTKGHPRHTGRTTVRDLSDVGRVLGSNAHVIFVATKVKNKAKAKTTPIVTQYTGRVGVLAIKIIAVPFHFRKLGGVSRTLSNIRRVSGRMSTLLIVGGRHLQRVCPRLAILGTFTGTSSALSMTMGDVTRVVAMRKHVGLSFRSIGAMLGSNNITVVDANVDRNRKHIGRTVRGTLRSPLLGGGSVCDSGGILLGVLFDRRRRDCRLAVRRVGRIRRFVDGFNSSIRIG